LLIYFCIVVADPIIKEGMVVIPLIGSISPHVCHIPIPEITTPLPWWSSCSM